MDEYISRKYAIERFTFEKDNYIPEKLVVGYDNVIAIRTIKRVLREIPAADVAPARHGRWIHPHWRNSVSAADCSEFGAEAQHIEYRGVQKYYKNCPSCGARMDKEANT